MPREAHPRFMNGRVGSAARGAKPLPQVLRTYSKNRRAHMLATAEDVSPDCQIIDLTDGVKNESHEDVTNEEYDDSLIVSDHQTFPGVATDYEDEQPSDASLSSMQVPPEVTYLTYQDIGGHRIYAPLKYLQVGNVVVQLVDAELQQNATQNVSGDCLLPDQIVINKKTKQVAKKKFIETPPHSGVTNSSDAVQSRHWADVYVQEENKTLSENESDAKTYIIGQDDNEVNVHIITKDGKETTTIINTYREVEQTPNKASHGGNENCRCRLCEGKKNNSYVDAFQQFLSQHNVVKGSCSEPPKKKVKLENPWKSEVYSPY